MLATATRVDLHTHESEVESIQKVYQEYTGDMVSVADIRVAAIVGVREEGLKPVAKNAGKLSAEHRRLMIQGLRAVLLADDALRSTEIEYFNLVSKMLDVTHADAAGLVSVS